MDNKSQSPSLRGSGRFPRPHAPVLLKPGVSQSPSLRGSGRFHNDDAAAVAAVMSQSPSLRGSGRFAGDGAPGRGAPSMSQSPSLRGSGRFSSGRACAGSRGSRSQSPSLRGSGRFADARRCAETGSSRLNPLHCGAVVASGIGIRWGRGEGEVSIPFIAGQWSLHGAVVDAIGCWLESQSPSLRGSGRFTSLRRTRPSRESGLNPLHCGAVVASAWNTSRGGPQIRVSIPFIAGQWSLHAL